MKKYGLLLTILLVLVLGFSVCAQDKKTTKITFGIVTIKLLVK
jgi:hypothetical protein